MKNNNNPTVKIAALLPESENQKDHIFFHNFPEMLENHYVIVGYLAAQKSDFEGDEQLKAFVLNVYLF